MWAFGAFDGGSNPPGTILSRATSRAANILSGFGAGNRAKRSDRGSNPPGTILFERSENESLQWIRYPEDGVPAVRIRPGLFYCEQYRERQISSADSEQGTESSRFESAWDYFITAGLLWVAAWMPPAAGVPTIGVGMLIGVLGVISGSRWTL